MILTFRGTVGPVGDGRLTAASGGWDAWRGTILTTFWVGPRIKVGLHVEWAHGDAGRGVGEVARGEVLPRELEMEERAELRRGHTRAAR